MVCSSDLDATSGERSGYLSCLARLPVVSDAVLKSVFTGIEIRVLLFLFVFEFL